MEIRHLKYFKAVADARSFVHGARYLRVAQPALSRAIAQLESEMGRALFVRHSGGVSLTDAGSIFYEQAVVILEQTQQLHERMSEEGTLRGTITLGAPQSIQSKVVAPIIAAFLERFPQCSVDLVQDSSGRLRDRVVDGAIDVAIISKQAVDGRLHQAPLLTEGFCLFAPMDSTPLEDANGAIDLTGVPLLICGYPSGQRHRLEQQLKERFRASSIRSQMNSSALMLDLVMQGAGVGVAPSCVVAQPRADAMKVIPLSGLQMSWVLATNWSKKGSRIVQTLHSMIVEFVRAKVVAGEWPTARLDDAPPHSLDC